MGQENVIAKAMTRKWKERVDDEVDISFDLNYRSKKMNTCFYIKEVE